MGGNVGDVRSTFRSAVAALARIPGVAGVRLSSLWYTQPLGCRRMQWFLNAVAALDFGGGASPPGPRELLGHLLDIERAHGRDRAREGQGGARPLDLDLLVWGDLALDDTGPPALVLPHPRLCARAFALAPLEELAGEDLRIAGPGGGRVADLLAAALREPEQQLRRVRTER